MKIIKPGRFVFHATYRGLRKSIMNSGILAGSNRLTNGRVFAHNAYRPNFSWYPFVFDELWEWNNLSSLSMLDNESVFRVGMEVYGDYWKDREAGYDFWRIDTQKLGRTWYVDESGERDFREDEKVPLYIFTEGDVPADCLTLYRFHENISVFKGDGVAHVKDSFRQVKL